jgi:cellulose synthase/poly-beta-1,6-N-acetylglucosamine synthase-like glycosyltransferase
MKVSVIMISNRQDEAIARALASVASQGYRPLEVVLFGNGGRLEVTPGLTEAGIEVRTGQSPENLGVAGGRNAAVALSSGQAVLFLDDDAILGPDAIAHAVEALRSAPDVGAVAFRIVAPDTGDTALWLYPMRADTWQHRRFDAPSFVGCGGLVRRDAFDRLGGFWTGYFREMEEIDLCWRLLDSGLRIRYEPLAVVEHIERERRIYRYLVPGNLAMLWRLLPPGLALRQAAIKLPLFAVRAVQHGETREFLSGVAAIPGLLRQATREPARLDGGTVSHLRRLYGRGGPGPRIQWSLRRLPPPDLHPA